MHIEWIKIWGGRIDYLNESRYLEVKADLDFCDAWTDRKTQAHQASKTTVMYIPLSITLEIIRTGD